MPTIRPSDLMAVRFRIPGPFDWMGEEDFSVLRGGNAVVKRVTWTQGDPEIGSFDINDITIHFYSDSAGNTAITSGTLYNIGDQDLTEIITLENFIDAGDGTGSVDIRVNPAGITASELSAVRNLWIRLSVSQPNPGE